MNILVQQGESFCTDTSLGYGSDKKWLGKFVQAARTVNNGLLVLSSAREARDSKYSEMEIRHIAAAGVKVYIMYPSQKTLWSL